MTSTTTSSMALPLRAPALDSSSRLDQGSSYLGAARVAMLPRMTFGRSIFEIANTTIASNLSVGHREELRRHRS